MNEENLIVVQHLDNEHYIVISKQDDDNFTVTLRDQVLKLKNLDFWSLFYAFMAVKEAGKIKPKDVR